MGEQALTWCAGSTGLASCAVRTFSFTKLAAFLNVQRFTPFPWRMPGSCRDVLRLPFSFDARKSWLPASTQGSTSGWECRIGSLHAANQALRAIGTFLKDLLERRANKPRAKSVSKIAAPKQCYLSGKLKRELTTYH